MKGLSMACVRAYQAANTIVIEVWQLKSKYYEEDLVLLIPDLDFSFSPWPSPGMTQIIFRYLWCSCKGSRVIAHFGLPFPMLAWTLSQNSSACNYLILCWLYCSVNMVDAAKYGGFCVSTGLVVLGHWWVLSVWGQLIIYACIGN